MPRLTLETPHELGREEAVRRLKEKFGAAREAYSGQVGEMSEQWDDHTLSFGFTVLGMAISGTMAVDDSAVKLDTNLPLAAIMFRGTIEERARAELAALLS